MAFTVFDIETRIDKRLLREVFFAGAGLSDEEAYERFRQDPRNRGGDFTALTLHVPISIALGEVGEDYVLREVGSLARDEYSEAALVREFWRRAEGSDRTWVSFNGRGFDLPVLELAALRWGIAAPRYFDPGASAPLRARHGGRHLDLCDFLGNYGASGLRGGLDLLLKLLGMPGKGALSGAQVQAAYEAGRLDEIHRYCRTDVIQTYLLFLRVEVLRGRLAPAAYRAACAEAAPFWSELGVASAPPLEG